MCAASTSSVRVVSYNVLSSHLCEPSYFVRCQPQDLAPAARLKKIQAKIDAEILSSRKGHTPTIVCLQEVARDWDGPLHVFFAQRNYRYASALYGHRGNGYMGVAIAWPDDSLRVTRLEALRLSDLVDDGHRKNGNGGNSKIVDERKKQNLVSRLWSASKAVADGLSRTASALVPFFKARDALPAPFEPWREALRRQNVLVSVALEGRTQGFGQQQGPQKTRAFTVSTYHMPCLFGSPEKEQVMVIHAALAARRARAFAEGAPYVLCGDFNVKPGDACYSLLTTGALGDSPDHQERRPPPRETTTRDDTGGGNDWSLDGDHHGAQPALVSAYASKVGAEPDFTNFAFTRNDLDRNEAFVATLDYVFLSPDSGWTVSDVKPLAPRSSVDATRASYPDATEPSDHLLIAADLRLSDANKTQP